MQEVIPMHIFQIIASSTNHHNECNNASHAEASGSSKHHTVDII